MLKGLIFDLDGTLVNSLSTTFDAFNHGLMSVGLRKHTPEEIARYFGAGENKIFEQMVGKERAAVAYSACCRYLDEHLTDVPLHNGVGELLEKIKTKDVPIAIFTGRSWNTTELILKHHRLLDQFVTVVANCHVSCPKPSPEGLHLALSRMELKPQEVIFVGDSPVDILASRAAGTVGVAALWDLMADRKQLETHQPDHWAITPLELWEIWEQLRESKRVHE